jgi:hypothetical protein
MIGSAVIFPTTFTLCFKYLHPSDCNTGVLISPWPDQEGNKLQRQKILSFIYPIYNHNGGILVLFMYITRLASNEMFSPSNKIHREVGWAKDLSAPW